MGIKTSGIENIMRCNWENDDTFGTILVFEQFAMECHHFYEVNSYFKLQEGNCS